MRPGNLPREAQPKSRAFHAPAARIVHAHEPFKNFLSLAFRNFARIRDLQPRTRSISLNPMLPVSLHFTALSARFARPANEIAIARHHHVVRDLRRHAQPGARLHRLPGSRTIADKSTGPR